MFGEIRVSNFFKASQSQMTEVDLKGRAALPLGEEHVASCLPALPSPQRHVLTCPEPYLHISFSLFPQDYDETKSSCLQPTTYFLPFL